MASILESGRSIWEVVRTHWREILLAATELAFAAGLINGIRTGRFDIADYDFVNKPVWIDRKATPLKYYFHIFILVAFMIGVPWVLFCSPIKWETS